MGASDLIKALQNLARRGPSTYGECRIKPFTPSSRDDGA